MKSQLELRRFPFLQYRRKQLFQGGFLRDANMNFLYFLLIPVLVFAPILRGRQDLYLDWNIFARKFWVHFRKICMHEVVMNNIRSKSFQKIPLVCKNLEILSKKIISQHAQKLIRMAPKLKNYEIFSGLATICKFRVPCEFFWTYFALD